VSLLQHQRFPSMQTCWGDIFCIKRYISFFLSCIFNALKTDDHRKYIYKSLVPPSLSSSHRTYSVPIIKTNLLILLRTLIVL
jgi:hypothetical protein